MTIIAAMLTSVALAAGAVSKDCAHFDPAPVDALLASFVDDGRAAGVSALIARNGAEVYFGAFGMRDREAGLPMTRDTIVQIQSMTKPITGVALMQQLDLGRFDLDDPLPLHAPIFSELKVWKGYDDAGAPILVEPARPPSIRDLTRHTAGFLMRSHPSPLAAEVRKAHPIDSANTLDEFARKLAALPLLYEPGERFNYAYSTDVEAYLVERLSQERFDEYLKTHLFSPLGMADTGYVVSGADRDRIAAVYAVDAHGLLQRAITEDQSRRLFRKQPLTPGGFGLASTLDDYMRFASMLLGGGEFDDARLLAPETARMMLTDHLQPDATNRGWPTPDRAYGWGVDLAVRIAAPDAPNDFFGHIGEAYWEGGLGTMFWIDPAHRIAAVFFVQLASDARPLHAAFRQAVYAGAALDDLSTTSSQTCAGAPAP